MEESIKEANRSWEQYFLPEIVYEICQNLNVHNLSKVAFVNKLWNETATRVLATRGPERALVSYPYISIHESIRVKPYVTLMFMAAEVKVITKCFQEDILMRYKDQIPHNLVIVGTHSLMMDEKLITICDALEEGEMLSLLIPKYRDLRVRAAYTQNLSRMKSTEDFLTEFIPEDSKSKATFLIFGQSMFDNSQFFELLRKCMNERQQKYNLWGAAFPDASFASVSGKIDENATKEFEDYGYEPAAIGYNGMFAMSITGSSVESFSVVIDCITTKQKFDEKLKDFKKDIQLKRHRIGFACGPEKVFDDPHAYYRNTYTNHQAMMHAVKIILSDVPFIGIFNESSSSLFYGLKFDSNDDNEKLQHQKSLSVMILTYD